jgi:pimeloyl-ACP methyl ester carboxylesterase
VGNKKFLAIPCLLACLCPSLLAQQAKTARQPRLQTQHVDVGGYKLRLQTAGSGTPTVILDSGFGNGLEVWSDVFPEVARFARVIAYDRAGLGESQPGPEPRSFTQIATELHTLLHRAGFPPPYVLVGHSMGSSNIRAFAHLFKKEVAGMVFVDPANTTVSRLQSEKEREAEMAKEEGGIQNAPAGVQAEWKFLKNEALGGHPQLGSFGRPPDVPMMLLVAGRDRPPHWEESVLSEYGTWMVEATEGSLLLTPNSTHYIQRDEPWLVVSAIRRVVFPDALNVLQRAIKEKGADETIALYRRMRQRYPVELLSERTLNTLGYQQLRANHTKEAIAIFKLNVEMYPKGFNTYDSLGEAYMVHGDRESAIRNYRKSLALNPKNTNAAEMLKKMASAP